MSHSRPRGQSGLELIAGLGMLLLIVMGILLIVMDKTAETSRVKTFLDAKRIATSVKDNVDMIVQQGPGYFSYFSVPATIHGGYEYDIVMRGNAVEVMWLENVWTSKISTSNVTVHCLSKGLTFQNRVLNTPTGVEVFCHRPNLVIPRDKVSIVNKNSTTFEVLNDAHVPSGQFVTSFTTNNTQLNMTFALGPYERRAFNINESLGSYVTLWADMLDEINESVEYDNNLTVYL
jgi:hypothetical protein